MLWCCWFSSKWKMSCSIWQIKIYAHQGVLPGGGGWPPQNRYLLFSEFRTQFQWNLTTTFITRTVPKFVHGIKKNLASEGVYRGFEWLLLLIQVSFRTGGPILKKCFHISLFIYHDASMCATITFFTIWAFVTKSSINPHYENMENMNE